MGLTRWQRAEVGSGTITTASSATSATGIIAPKKPWPVRDGSHVYVGKLEFCNLGAWLGTPGPRGTVGRAGNIWKKTESKTSGRIENQNAKTRNRNVCLTPVEEVRPDMVIK